MMLIPGGNILNMALRVINPQGVQWQRFTGRVRNAGGDFVNAYAPVAAIVGSLQPVDQKAYVMLGLDLSKTYVTLYTSAQVQTLERDTAGDLVSYAGKLYETKSRTDWHGQDGWSAYLCVEVVTP